jgi:hypothetical protein
MSLQENTEWYGQHHEIVKPSVLQGKTFKIYHSIYYKLLEKASIFK